MRQTPQQARRAVWVGLLGPVLAAGCGQKLPEPPAEAKAAPAELRAESAAKLKQIHLGFDRYGGGMVLPANRPRHTPVPVSWRVWILPGLDQRALFHQYHLNEPWDSEHNKALIPKMPAVYAPVAGTAADGETFYQMFVGPETPYEEGKSNNIGMFAHGTAYTILVAEAATPVVWTKPDDIAFDPAGDAPTLGGMFGGEFRAVLADGSVRTSRPGYDPVELKKAITHSGPQFNEDKLWVADPKPVRPSPPPRAPLPVK